MIDDEATTLAFTRSAKNLTYKHTRIIIYNTRDYNNQDYNIQYTLGNNITTPQLINHNYQNR